MDPTTHVFQVREEAENAPVAFIKFEINGTPRAVSGKYSQVMVTDRRLEIHDITEMQASWFVKLRGLIFDAPTH